MFTPLNDAETAACVTAERAMSRACGSCHTLGGYAELQHGMLTLCAFVAEPDGRVVYTAQAQRPLPKPSNWGNKRLRNYANNGSDY